MNKKIHLKFLTLVLITLIGTQAYSISLFDGKWYGNNPCAFFDEAQDVVLEIDDGKAKVNWGEKYNLNKYRGKVYQSDKLGLNSNAGRVEGRFTSADELVLNKGVTFTNDDGVVINCEFTLTKNEIKEEKTAEEIAEEEAITEEEEAEEEVNTIIENIPDWYLIQPDGGNLFGFFAGQAESVSIQVAKDLAETEALESLARSLDTRISQQVNKMVDQIGLDGDVTLTTEMTEVTKTTTRLAQVAGWKYEETAVQQKGTKYIVYVLLRYRYSESNKILLEQIKIKHTSVEKLRVSKAFQDLEEEVNKSQ